MSEAKLTLSDDLFEKLPEEEKNSEFIAMALKTFAKDAWDRFRRNKLALFGLIFLTIIIILAIVVPMVSPYQFDTQDMANRNALPSMQHLFGTDKLGRDIFVRVMYGARVSLSIAFATAAINLVIGVLYGGISGYVGGRVDMIMMRIIDVIYAVPSLIYIVLIRLSYQLDRNGQTGKSPADVIKGNGILTGSQGNRRQPQPYPSQTPGSKCPGSNHRLSDHDGTWRNLYRSFIKLRRHWS